MVERGALQGPSTQPWPLSDAMLHAPLPGAIDATRLKQVVDAACNPAAGKTVAFVVT